MEKSGYPLTNKTKSVPTIQKPGQTCQNPQFSDVIAIEGFQQPFLHLFDLKPMPKKGARKSPLNCRLKSRLNRLYFKNNHFKRYFLSAWTPLPLEPENCIRKKAIGAQIEPGMPHVPGIGISSYNTRIPKLSDTLSPRVRANTPGVFDQTDGIDILTEPELRFPENLGREKARIRGVINLGSARVRGRFISRRARGVRFK